MSSAATLSALTIPQVSREKAMEFAGAAIALTVAVFLSMLICLEGGFRIGRHHAREIPASDDPGTGAIAAAVFALLGLLLAFAFAGSTTRLENRRDLIVQEANAIGTAYLRLDLLPETAQPDMRRLFRQYVDSRLLAYDKLPDRRAVDEEMKHAADLQGQIWTRAVAASRADASGNAARLLLPALNDMIDITTTRKVALDTHLPALIFFLLILIALLSALLAGYSMAARQRRSLFHMLLYAAVTAITIYAVSDLEYPRSGLIRLDAADRALTELRDSIR